MRRFDWLDDVLVPVFVTAVAVFVLMWMAKFSCWVTGWC